MKSRQIETTQGLDLLCSYRNTQHHGLNLYSAIAASLNEDEVYVIMTDNDQDRNIRDTVMRKVLNDLIHGNCSHRKLIQCWKRQALSTEAKTRRDASLNLSRVIPLCKGDYSKLIISFLTDDSPLIRRRGNNLIMYLHKNDEHALIESLERAWVKYEDDFMARAVCERASLKFLFEHFINLWYMGTPSILVNRLYNGGYNILEALKEDYPEEYLYYSAVFHVDVPDDVVLRILAENRQSEKVARLIWSVGFMKKYDVLRELMKPEWKDLFEPFTLI